MLVRFLKPLTVVAIVAFVLATVWTLSSGRAESTSADPPSVPSPHQPRGNSAAKINGALLARLQSGATEGVLVRLKEQADLSAAGGLPTKAAKGRYVFEQLRATALRSQAGLRSELDAQRLPYTAYFISNLIYVPDVDIWQVLALAARADVELIQENAEVEQQQLTRQPRTNSDASPTRVAAVEDNLAFINVDDVWSLGLRGRGLVLAAIDSGIDPVHPALAPHYRGCLNPPLCSDFDHNYNWYDATRTYWTYASSGDEHGTHVSGIMVGDDGVGNQIGVAPDATTIHCKAFKDASGGSMDAIIACLQWMLAPTDLNGANPRPDLAPDVLNNSWGYYGGKTNTYVPELEALQAAGILVEAISHNYGPACGSVTSPGSIGSLLTVGSVYWGVNHVLPGFISSSSGRGPSQFLPTQPDYFPDIMAPGDSIRSSIPGAAYEWYSGTSMAGPHVAAVVGLLWQANPLLQGDLAATQQVLLSTAVPLTGQAGSSCGGDYTTGPNNDWGYGTVDALAAVEKARSLTEFGNLAGRALKAGTGEPIAGASIQIHRSTGQSVLVASDAGGDYSAVLPIGEYSLEATAYGFLPAQFAAVTISEEATTTAGLSMVVAPLHAVSGIVRDALTQEPLAARLFVDNYPGSPFYNDAATGAFSVSLPAGRVWTIRATPAVAGYLPVVSSSGLLAADVELFLDAAADRGACSAPNYTLAAIQVVDFEAGNGGFTVSKFISNDPQPSWAWGAPSTGPAAAHSGSKVWATNLSGAYGNYERSYLTSPVIDLSSYTGQALILNWWQWLQSERAYDVASVEASKNGGSTWYTVYEGHSGDVDLAWARRGTVLDASYAVSNFAYRFRFRSDGGLVAPGWYLDDITLATSCDPSPLAVDLGSFTATPTQDVVLLQWTTVSEVDNLGFNVLRGESEAGPFKQVNATLIASQAPGSSEGASYRWTDARAVAGTKYWYVLEDLDVHGARTRSAPASTVAQSPNAIGVQRFRATALPAGAWGVLAAVLSAGAALAFRRLSR